MYVHRGATAETPNRGPGQDGRDGGKPGCALIRSYSCNDDEVRREDNDMHRGFPSGGLTSRVDSQTRSPWRRCLEDVTGKDIRRDQQRLARMIGGRWCEYGVTLAWIAMDGFRLHTTPPLPAGYALSPARWQMRGLLGNAAPTRQ
ncbi:hypothetical protein LshimejAT787_1202440 [Lyophyllum shimeji]|uniref:Uncharacterized protein n=1 Tax=Lyophyllum shimeji TaxID=47721 RepID=A0A9P3PTW7_LYOSH|nr:hypothetical protein LshimejAT787_1202440 [Lyophyllum shimeji]